MKTTFGRNFLTHTLILLTALLITGTSFQYLVRQHLETNAVDSLKNDSKVIAGVAAAYLSDDSLSNEDFLVTLSVAAKISQSDAVLCDTRGRLVMCSGKPMGCEHQGMQLSNPQYLQRIRTEEYLVTTGYIQGLYPDERYSVSTAIRDPDDGTLYGLVIVSTSTEATRTLLSQMSRFYLLISLLVLVAALIFMTVYARKTSIPLRNMAKTATDFGHGNLKARATITPNSPREIRELAIAFNNMAASLEKSEYQHREFVANVSHELKTPMTTIGGYVDGILDGTIPQEQQEQYLALVSDETKRLSRLVRSMLDIAQLQGQGIPEEKKTDFDIVECAGQVLISFEQQINDKKLDVDVSIPDYPVYTFAYRDTITQVIYNLTDNAVKFCPEGGTLRLRIHDNGHKLFVSIANTGPTIPAEELPMLFNRFHKLDRSRSANRDSWGLGLYIVKTIVCSHGEDISVTSKNDLTEFTFTLPLVN